MSLQKLIKREKHQVFRRIYIKRRELDGEYDVNWYRIPDKDIISFGSISYNIDDILPNFYDTGGLNFQLSNLNSGYSETDNSGSIFYNKLAIKNTLVRMDAGYIDDDGTEYPTNSTLFIGVISNDSNYTEDLKANFSCKQLSSVFQEFPADQISGLGATQTASEIIEKIRDYQDGNGVYYFQKYITSSAWNIETTTVFYNIATSTTLSKKPIWGLMQDLAVAENFFLSVDNNQGFNFISKSTISTTADFKFSGIGDDHPTWGFNIISDFLAGKNYRKIYNRIKVKFDSPDTLSSYYIKNETVNWGNSSSSFIYGIKEYSYENLFLVSNTAQSISTNIYNEYVNPKGEASFKSKFVPHLNPNDRVTLTYRPFLPEAGGVWDFFLWDVVTDLPSPVFTSAIWASKDKYVTDINETDFRIITIEHNIDDFTNNINLREI